MDDFGYRRARGVRIVTEIGTAIDEFVAVLLGRIAPTSKEIVFTQLMVQFSKVRLEFFTNTLSALRREIATESASFLDRPKIGVR